MWTQWSVGLDSGWVARHDPLPSRMRRSQGHAPAGRSSGSRIILLGPPSQPPFGGQWLSCCSSSSLVADVQQPWTVRPRLQRRSRGGFSPPSLQALGASSPEHLRFICLYDHYQGNLLMSRAKCSTASGAVAADHILRHLSETSEVGRSPSLASGQQRFPRSRKGKGSLISAWARPRSARGGPEEVLNICRPTAIIYKDACA